MYSIASNSPRKFFAALDRYFPPSSKYEKFNRYSVKFSYSITSNLARIIAAHNKQKIREYLNFKSINKSRTDNVYSEINFNDTLSEQGLGSITDHSSDKTVRLSPCININCNSNNPT